MSDKISELEKEIEFQINILKDQLLKNVNNENRKFKISIGGQKYTVCHFKKFKIIS